MNAGCWSQLTAFIFKSPVLRPLISHVTHRMFDCRCSPCLWKTMQISCIITGVKVNKYNHHVWISLDVRKSAALHTNAKIATRTTREHPHSQYVIRGPPRSVYVSQSLRTGMNRNDPSRRAARNQRFGHTCDRCLQTIQAR